MAKLCCVNHPSREASARCPECKRYFCRECTTEHDSRILCASCLNRLTNKSGPRRNILSHVASLLLAFFSLGIIFVTFVILGYYLYNSNVLVTNPPN
jgi:uncharacterized paraquat-inducible protein A